MRPRLKKTIKIIVAVFALFMVLVLSFAYLQYRELKKTFLVKISGRATLFVGQKVEIKDMSFSPLLGINLHDITVNNPDDFPPGELLKIEKLYLSIRYRELVNRRLHFEKIIVHKPELTVMQDRDGRINISETFRDFFRRKSTFRYRIDEFSIQAGSVDFAEMGMAGPEHLFRSDTVNFQVKGLSSDPGVKTLIEGETSYAGNILRVQGWAYVKDEPKRLNISISSKDLAVIPLKEMLSRYGIDAEKTKITFALNAEGDTEKGLHLKSEVGIKKAGFTFFKRDTEDIRLETQAFLNIRENALLLKNISLEAGNITAATLTGEIRKSKGDFYYSAGLKIKRLDLSALNLMSGLKIGGIITSDNLRVRGSMKERSPEVSGIVRLRDGIFRSDTTDIGGVHAEMTFLPGDEISLKSEANARISKVYGYALDKPADTILKLTARGNLNRIDMISSVNLARIEVPVKGGNSVSVDSAALYLEGTLKGKIFGGEFRVGMENIKHDKYQSPWIRANSHITYEGNIITLKDPVFEEKDFKATAKHIAAGPWKKSPNKLTVEMKDLSVSYPARKAGISNADLFLNIVTGKSPIKGDFRFSAGGTKFSGFSTVLIKGGGAFNEKDFSLDIPNAEVSGGSLRLGMQGKTSEGPFPITIVSKAENIDLGKLLEEPLRVAEISYGMSGNLNSAVFEGTIKSPESIQGYATIYAEKLSLVNNDRRRIIKDVSLESGITFEGKDLSFRTAVNAGKMSANISGTVKEFAQKDRLAEMKISHPEVKVADIRETFWELFPESLLYAGLDGSLSSDFSVRFWNSAFLVNGKFNLTDIVLVGENGEYSVGPIRGVVPLAYSKKVHKQGTSKLPSFERGEFDNLRKYYSQKKMDESYSRLSLGTVSYGFKFLEDVDLWIRQEEQLLNIDWFSGRVFGGRLNGSAVVELADGMQYRAGFVLEGLSLEQLCDSIEPIRGYIYGNVSGTGTIKGNGTSLSDLMGKAEFWTYSTPQEKTKISKEFLHKVGGPSLTKYLGDRNFDKGVMNLYLQNGFVVFRELEISNRNLFGVKDLDIKVAPLNNRIAIDHLMWSITEAAYRAKKKE